MSIIQQKAVQMKRVSHGNYLMRSVLKHNVIFNEGSEGEEAYILTEGQVEISGIVEGHKKVFAVLKPVSIFGEMALFLEDNARTATAIALEDSKIIVVTKDDLDDFMKASPSVISSIINVLVSRLKSTTKRAMKAPSQAMGVVRILDLFAANGARTLKYDFMVKSLADTFVTTTDRIEGYLHGLADQRLVAIGRDDKDVRVLKIRSTNILNEVMSRKNS